jgi:hypothetical protein
VSTFSYPLVIFSADFQFVDIKFVIICNLMQQNCNNIAFHESVAMAISELIKVSSTSVEGRLMSPEQEYQYANCLAMLFDYNQQILHHYKELFSAESARDHLIPILQVCVDLRIILQLFSFFCLFNRLACVRSLILRVVLSIGDICVVRIDHGAILQVSEE